jgi:NADH-quinone oxidoreductase subunit D
MEYKTYIHALPYFDYVSPMCQKHSFALAIEKLLSVEVPERGQRICVLLAKIIRILNHMLNVTTFELDVGAVTPIMYGGGSLDRRRDLAKLFGLLWGRRCRYAAWLLWVSSISGRPSELMDARGISRFAIERLVREAIG